MSKEVRKLQKKIIKARKKVGRLEEKLKKQVADELEGESNFWINVHAQAAIVDTWPDWKKKILEEYAKSYD